ncbi:MAG: HAMP domain-containing sensor histidine kinase [Verrucomicrobia bacterium]|nr:HAMP domain-containing sensor histidine kinase [Verrucomicrobiota bacterium]
MQGSLVAITAALILLVGMLAGGSLWILRRMHGQSAHTEAARLVLEQGNVIVSHLAGQPIVASSPESAADWSTFAEQVLAMHTLESGLQYVSVSKNGVTVFQKQTRGMAEASVAPAVPGAGVAGDVGMSRRIVDLGGEAVPVVVFTKRLMGVDGTPREVEVAVRKDAVARQERVTAQAIGSMFNLSLMTVLGSFGVSVVLVAWMMRREVHRERQRRSEEHLAFAGVLANGIVHDFRNPMSAMRLDVQMLNREVAKAGECRHVRVAELATRVQQTLDRMDKVFQEFLYMSRPPTDRREVADVAKELRECAETLRPRFEQAGVDLRLDLPATPLPVLAYSSALQRTFMNVLTNAEQFSKSGQAVQVRAMRTDGSVTIDVVDEGPGVSEQDRRRIFDMFYSTRPGGTGLGLFLAKTALERCGGTIKVLATGIGRGTCFRMTLPVADVG